jgi:gluconolactonase
LQAHEYRLINQPVFVTQRLILAVHFFHIQHFCWLRNIDFAAAFGLPKTHIKLNLLKTIVLSVFLIIRPHGPILAIDLALATCRIIFMNSIKGTNGHAKQVNSLHTFFIALSLSASLVAPAAYANSKAPAIPGVVKAGTTIEFIKEGFDGTEGPIIAPDGSLLFTETRANRITRIAPDNQVSTFLENTNGANGLAFNKQGDLIAVQVADTQVGVIYPNDRRKVLVKDFDGKKFQRPNDLVLAKNGGVYFTDSGVNPGTEVTEASRTAVYYISPQGETRKVAEGIERPNGIQLSRDEKTLYVANTGGQHVLAFDVKKDGSLGKRRDFAKLSAELQKNDAGVLSSGADGLAIDNKDRLYVASNSGIEVFDKKGKALGVIPVPHKPQNIAFAGKDKKTLYVVGRGAAYKIAVETPGFTGRFK